MCKSFFFQALGNHIVQCLLVQDDCFPVNSHDLGLEAIRHGMGGVVGPDVISDQFDPGRVFGQGCDGNAPLLYLIQPLLWFVGKPLVKEHVQLGCFQMPFSFAAGKAHWHCCTVCHCVIDAVAVQISFTGYAKLFIGVMVVLLDGCACKTEEPCIWECGLKVCAQIFFLGAVAFVHQ